MLQPVVSRNAAAPTTTGPRLSRSESPEVKLPPMHPFAVEARACVPHVDPTRQRKDPFAPRRTPSAATMNSAASGMHSSASLPDRPSSRTSRTSRSDAASDSSHSILHTYCENFRPPPVTTRHNSDASQSTLQTTMATANSLPVTPTSSNNFDFGVPQSLSKAHAHAFEAHMREHECPAHSATDLIDDLANLGLEDEDEYEYDGVLPYDVTPSPRRVFQTAECMLRDEEGGHVRFGDLLPGPDAPKGAKTVVFFIRHLWCGICQDYTLESISRLDPGAIAAANVRVVIVSFGKWKIVRKYRELFKCPFPIYVDGPRRLYERLGMYRMFRSVKPPKSDDEKGGKPRRAAYNRWPFAWQVAQGLTAGLFRMPLTLPGNLFQFGGEYIFSQGYKCDFSHRLTGTLSDHIEAPEVLRLAGVAVPTRDLRSSDFDDEHMAALAKLEAEMNEWNQAREAKQKRLRARAAKLREEHAAKVAAGQVAPDPTVHQWEEAPELSGARMSFSDDEHDRNAIGVGL